MNNNSYEKITAASFQEIEEAISRGDEKFLSRGVIAVAWTETDRIRAEKMCLQLSSHPNESVRGNAILSIGYLAMRFDDLSMDMKAIIERRLLDHSEFVKGQSWAAASDARKFLKWDIKGFQR